MEQHVVSSGPFFRASVRIGTGAQPQRDVCWLHRFCDDCDQIVAEGAKVRLVPERRGERFEGLSRVILATVEAPIYERLGASSQWVEQGSYHEGGDHHGEGVLLARKGDETSLQHHDAAEVEPDEHGCE